MGEHFTESGENTQQIGCYKIIRRIGEGSTGRVFEVESVTDHRHWAMKVFNGTEDNGACYHRKLFLFEATVLRALGRSKKAHSMRILDVHDICYEQPYYYVMDLITSKDGTITTLCDLQRSSAQADVDFSEEKLIGWFVDIASELTFLHHNGLVHGDVTPSNIVLDDQGHAVLVDFGSARPLMPNLGCLIEDDCFDFNNPIFKMVNPVTTGFAAPENYNVSMRPSIAADSYSLAATFWYLLFNETIDISKYAKELINKDEYRCLFEDSRWSRILPLMLEHDACKRITVEEALQMFHDHRKAESHTIPAMKECARDGFDLEYEELLDRMNDYAGALSELRWNDAGETYEKEFVIDAIYKKYRTAELRLLKIVYDTDRSSDIRAAAQKELHEQDMQFMSDFNNAGLAKLADMLFYKLNALWATAGNRATTDDGASIFIESRVSPIRAYLSVEAQFVFGKYRHIQWSLDGEYYFRDGKFCEKYRGERTADRLFMYERTLARYIPAQDVIAMHLETLSQRNRIERLEPQDTFNLKKIWRIE